MSKRFPNNLFLSIFPLLEEAERVLVQGEEESGEYIASSSMFGIAGLVVLLSVLINLVCGFDYSGSQHILMFACFPSSG